MTKSSRIIAAFFALCTVTFATSTIAANNWVIEQKNDPETGKSGCVLITPKLQINDGYGDSSIQLIVFQNRLEIKTESNLDGSGVNAGIQVDQNSLILLEGVKSETIGIFKKSLPIILKQFKAGSNVQIKMRFWPTWPEVAVDPASFSLSGFTAAFDSCLKNN